MTAIIPVAAPVFDGNEREYLLDCFDSSRISSSGNYLDRFEAGFASFCRARQAIACVNGTAAIHLALLAVGVGPGDEVLLPDVTFIATANAVTYCGAKPVFVDVKPDSWNIDPELAEAAISPRTKAIIAVHLYGLPANLHLLGQIARRHGLALVEDAAEAHGALCRGTPVGAIGDVGAFSFYGNKIITTGEGGMVVTQNQEFADRIRQLKGQGQDFKRRYWFPVVGYNYRMNNLQAAIGLAQLERAEWHMAQHRRVAQTYFEMLEGLPGLTLPLEPSWARHAFWMFTVLLDNATEAERDHVMAQMAKDGVETRPMFYPIHQLPPYRELQPAAQFPVSTDVAARGISLPTWAGLTKEQIHKVVRSLRRAVGMAPEGLRLFQWS
jgi:perosamine synthetase